MAFVCYICDNALVSKSNLRVHMRIHSGERPFKCHKCTKTFTQSGNLKTHERTHTGQRPFICHKCTKAFTSSSDLKRHERTHTGTRPFKCHHCAKTFTQASNLKLHERTHTGERPYKCDNCNKTFTRAHNLKHHERTHTCENNSTSSNNNERKCPFKNSRLEEFPQPDISTRNLNKIEGENGYSYQVYHYKFPMKNQITNHREIRSEDRKNHSKQSSSNMQSSTSIHPEQHSFQDGITNQNVANYQNLTTRFNAMNKANFPHQFISQNIQPAISTLDMNIQTQSGKNIPTLNERQDTNSFSFNAENGQNFNMSIPNTGILIEHPSESVSYSARNINKSFPSISKVTEERQLNFDNFSGVSSEFDISSEIFNFNTHHSMFEYQQSYPIEEYLPERNATSILNYEDVYPQIKNTSFVGNTYYQNCLNPSKQKQESFSTASRRLETDIQIGDNILDAIPWIELS